MRRAASGIWSEVEALVKAGQRPVIHLSPATKVISRRAVGRPRVHPEGAKRGHGYRWRTPSGGRCRCRNKGCDQLLKKNAVIPVCSVACEEELRRYCELLLAALDKRIGPKDLPPDLRGRPRAYGKRLREG